MKKHSEGFLRVVNEARPGVNELNIEEARARLAQNPDAQLIDVREESEWAKGHAKGARHLSKGVIERDIEAQIPDKSTEIILYCGGGFRSILAAEVVQRMGYTNVTSMDGGWRGWRDSGAPTEES